jgi:Pretoxin HINT domain
MLAQSAADTMAQPLQENGLENALSMRRPWQYANVAKGVVLVSVCLLFACAPPVDAGDFSDAAPRSALAPQRVNDVVRRQTQQLVHIETGHQSFVTTPEHPFARVGSGWVPAGDLAPGDWLISAKFGRVRVYAVYAETLAEPVLVFNLGVERTHAYLIGTDQVLVHNTGCNNQDPDILRRQQELEEARRELDVLNSTPQPTSKKDASQRKKRIAQLEKRIAQLTTEIHNARSPVSTRQARPRMSEEERSKEIEDLQAELRRLQEIQPSSDADLERRTKLKDTIAKLKAYLARIKSYRKRLETPELVQKRTAPRKPPPVPEAELRRQLEAAQAELRRLQERDPSPIEEPLLIKRQIVELKRRVGKLTTDLQTEQQLNELRRGLVTLEKTSSTSDALTRQRNKIKAQIRELEHQRAARERRRKDPQDAQLLDQELSRLQPLPSSPTRDATVQQLAERNEALGKTIKLRQKLSNLRRSATAQEKRKEKLLGEGRDTKDIDDKLAEIEKERIAVKERLAERRAREGQPGPGREGGDSQSPEERLEQTLDASRDPQTAPRERLDEETSDVDATLLAFFDDLQKPPSPTRTAAVRSRADGLRRQLEEERRQFEVNDVSLFNEYSDLTRQAATHQPGSSLAPRRLKAERTRLRTRWRESMEERRLLVLRELREVQRIPAFRDAEFEVELWRQIKMYEHERDHPPWTSTPRPRQRP